MDCGSQDYTEVDFTNLADVCAMMPTRLLVTGLLVQWLQGHFADPINIVNPFMQNYVWTDDIATTKISIDTVFRYNPAMTEFRPGIFIKPGPWKVMQYGIDNRMMVSMNRPASCDPLKSSTYTTITQGSHVLFCVSDQSAEIELLAREVYAELMEFGPVFRRLFNFLRFVVSDIGEISLIEEAEEHFVVPITVSYGVQDIWQVCQSPPELEYVKENLWSFLIEEEPE